MFNTLVESCKTGSALKTKVIFLTSISIPLLFASILILSLLRQNLASVPQIGDLSLIVQPPYIPPERERSDAAGQSPEHGTRSKPVIPSAVRYSETIVPSKAATDRPVSIPSELTPGEDLSLTGTGPFGSRPGPRVSGVGGSGNGFGMKVGRKRGIDKPTTTEIRKPPPLVSTKPITISKGPVNGMAISLPKPGYSRAARIAGAKGLVEVRVLIDKDGSVISAVAVKGPRLHWKESVRAALRSKFTPTTLGGVPVRVKGVIRYNFQ